MEWYEIVVGILSGLAVAIPLVVELVKYVRAAVQEKNWQVLLRFVMELMAEAEGKFEDGVSKKEWVLRMVEASATTINYEIDIARVGELIDSLCAMSHAINAGKKTEEVSE